MIRIGKISKNEEEYYFAYDKGKWREVKVKDKVWRSLKNYRYLEGELNEEDGTIIKRVRKVEGNLYVDYFIVEKEELTELKFDCKEISEILSEKVYLCNFEDKMKLYRYEDKMFEDKIQLQNYIHNKLKKEFEKDLIQIQGKIKAETQKAYLFSVRGKEVWVPKSLCTLGENYIEIPLWFAKSNSLISEKDYNQILSEKMKKFEDELSKIVFI